MTTRTHISDFEGWLHADGYTGCDALTHPRGNQPAPISHVAWMAHAPRKLFDVIEATEAPIAEEALPRIGALCAVEAEITGKPAERPFENTDGSAWRVFSDPAVLRSLPTQLASAALRASRRRRAFGPTQGRKIPCQPSTASILKRSLSSAWRWAKLAASRCSPTCTRGY